MREGGGGGEWGLEIPRYRHTCPEQHLLLIHTYMKQRSIYILVYIYIYIDCCRTIRGTKTAGGQIAWWFTNILGCISRWRHHRYGVERSRNADVLERARINEEGKHRHTLGVVTTATDYVCMKILYLFQSVFKVMPNRNLGFDVHENNTTKLSIWASQYISTWCPHRNMGAGGPRNRQLLTCAQDRGCGTAPRHKTRGGRGR